MKKLICIVVLAICFGVSSLCLATTANPTITVVNTFSDGILKQGDGIKIAEITIISTLKKPLTLLALTVVTESDVLISVENIQVSDKNDPTCTRQESHAMEFVIPAKRPKETGSKRSYAVEADIRGTGEWLLVTVKNFVFKDDNGKIYFVPDELNTVFTE